MSLGVTLLLWVLFSVAGAVLLQRAVERVGAAREGRPDDAAEPGETLAELTARLKREAQANGTYIDPFRAQVQLSGTPAWQATAESKAVYRAFQRRERWLKRKRRAAEALAAARRTLRETLTRLAAWI